jgi:hypothetical protein
MADPPIPLGMFSVAFGGITDVDPRGEQILWWYLAGDGEARNIYDDAIWTDYMKANEGLRRQVFAKLQPVVEDVAARKKEGRVAIGEQFHAECPENSGWTGYALLHGTDRTVGDFRLVGWAEVEDAVDPAHDAYDIELDLRFVFNDVVNVNAKYWTDKVKNGIAEFISLGGAESYNISISWPSSCLAEVRPGQPIFYSGYPSDKIRIVRPLPRAKLDWVSGEKERAKKIEREIITQLRRQVRPDDIAGLADRRKKLLGLFYSLSGYMQSTYLERLSQGAHHDDLPRLLRDRISSELRAELREALRGRRPP